MMEKLSLEALSKGMFLDRCMRVSKGDKDSAEYVWKTLSDGAKDGLEADVKFVLTELSRYGLIRLSDIAGF